MTSDCDDWRKLSAQERVERCRVLATEARQQASAAKPVNKSAYQALAAQWLDLANQIEQMQSINTEPGNLAMWQKLQ
jgi:hypothetical protein